MNYLVALALLAFTAIGLANAAYFLTSSRIVKAGHSVKRLLTPKDIAQTLRTYRELAPHNDWSIWPALAFWPLVLTGVFLILSILVAINGKTSGDLAVPTIVTSRQFIVTVLGWLILQAVFQAIWFTRSILQGQAQPRIRQTRGQVPSREDLVLAILGWVAVIGFSILLLWYTYK